MYSPPQDATRTWKGLVVQASPPKNLRGGVIWPNEDGNWMVVLGGSGKDYPPTDEEGFLEFAKNTPEPMFYEAFKDAQPLSQIYGYRRTENRLRHFERMARLPEGLLVVGDAVCAFNPVYGQGMTVAALGAIALDDSLRQRGLLGLPRYFQRKLAKINATPWQLATAADYRVPAFEGTQPSLITKLLYRYNDIILELVLTSSTVSKTFSGVVHLTEPPTALFRPAILSRVLLHALSRKS